MRSTPREFYCVECDARTEREDWTEYDLELISEGSPVSPSCNRCGEVYQCDECGYAIDQDGDCLRRREEEDDG